jgi:hypothetical protein
MYYFQNGYSLYGKKMRFGIKKVFAGVFFDAKGLYLMIIMNCAVQYRRPPCGDPAP